MGDRAMAQIKTTDGDLYFYTHWHGQMLPEIAQRAVEKATVRKGDDAYALRILVDKLILLTGARDMETGCGLMLLPNAEDEYNSHSPSVLIDLKTMTVELLGRRKQ